MSTRRTNTSGDTNTNGNLSFEGWQQFLAEDVAGPSAASGSSSPSASAAAPSMDDIFVDPSLLTEGDLATYHAPSQLPPLSWTEQTHFANESFVSMTPPLPLPPPTLTPVAELRRIEAAAPRRSARIAAAPRVEEKDAYESNSSSSMSVSDDMSDDGSDAKATKTDPPMDKKERRRGQVREASKRRRAKLKKEEEFIKNRSREQEEHMDMLDKMFPLP